MEEKQITQLSVPDPCCEPDDPCCEECCEGECC